MDLSICVYLSGLLLSCAGLHVLGPSGPLIVKLGGSLLLPCYTETLIPLEELEVEWMRTDSESLVHLFQDGEIRPESQNQAYSGRASFFTEEIKHGNFSLLLTNITTEDAGVYNCSVYWKDESAQTSVQIKEIERLTVTGGHVISAYAGEAVTLNCSVDSHIPTEEMEEVSWKKVDQDILVLMFQDGEVKTESAHGSYMGRVEFFSLDEIHKGNFSLRLKDLRTEDKGLYMCEVFSGEFSANATVEVQQLGFSSMHIGVLVLCSLAFVFVLVFLIYNACTYFEWKYYGRTALSVQCALVISPNVTMFLAFILWGVIEGFFREAAICSALNLLRIGFLFWTAPYLNKFQDNVCKFIKRSAVTLEYAVITTVAYSGLALHSWQLYQETKNWGNIFFTVFFAILLLVLYIIIFAQGFAKENNGYWNYVLAAGGNVFRGLFVALSYGRNLGVVIIVILQFLPFFTFSFLFIYSIVIKNVRMFVFLLMSILILEVLNTSLSVYVHDPVLELNKERVVLTCVTVFLHILTTMLLFPVPVNMFGSGSTETQQTSGHVMLYIFGTLALVCVNSIALAVELILKARNGERTVEDLRVILIPSECVFALCCLTLQITTFCRGHREIFVYALSICGCKRTSADSVERNHELEAFQSTEAASAAQETGT